MDTPPAIAFRDVSFSLGTGLRIFSGLNLEVPAGQRWVLAGTSGVGTSFFARLALGLFRPSRGRIEVLGVDVSHCPTHELPRIRQRVGFVFRDARLISNLSVERNIALPLNYHRSLRPEAVHGRVEGLLDLLGLEPVRHLRPVGLSAEQRMLTALARAAVMAPEAVFCDDPLAGFSPDVSRRLLDALGRVCEWALQTRGEGGPSTVLVTASDPGPYIGFADRFGVVQDGRVRLDRDALSGWNLPL